MFELLGIPDAPGAHADHADTDAASLNPGTGELVFCVITDAHTVASQRVPGQLLIHSVNQELAHNPTHPTTCDWRISNFLSESMGHLF